MDIDDDAFDRLNDPTTGQRRSYDMKRKSQPSNSTMTSSWLKAESPNATVKQAAKHTNIPYAYYVKRWRSDVAKGEAISLSANPSM
jgi:uncharacterized protein YeaO (DUF488 family)